ncbi:hypothetical protein GE09DRAFT_981767 [Coniochaeta sp. 2T2.1]|nr:hypothetical protein GE09DRAFT_981767 [Coniochaeta sp. 2T2.1]
MNSTILPQFHSHVSSPCARCTAKDSVATRSSHIYRYGHLLYIYIAVLCTVALAYALFHLGKRALSSEPQSCAANISKAGLSPDVLYKRDWGFDERPTTRQCYAQERTAMLLALFLGPLGVDQFYAQHWPLAIFKLLTGGGLGLWSLIDIVLWMVGGIYGTPGCPGGSSRGWAY